jgi:hypothetical protein
MIYRPQYVFPPTPAGFVDEQFHYSFDSTNTPVLGLAIAAGVTLRNVYLQLQNDAEFILRAIKVQLGTSPSNLYLSIRDPHSFPLSAVHLPLNNYLTPGGASIVGSMMVPFESEVVCPAGGFFILDLYNPTTGNVTPPAFTLDGVNRRQCGRMAA